MLEFDDMPWLVALKSRLNEQYFSGRLHHGLLLDGFTGSGKYLFANHYAQALLCGYEESNKPCGECKSCHLFKTGAHPDYIEINDVEANSIGVDLVRNIVKRSQMKAQLGGNQVFVIRDCHKMTEAAANALLKTLEEPNARTYIILTTQSLLGMLATIISRCQLYKLTAPSIKQLEPWLAGKSINVDDFSVIYSDVGQAPLKTLTLLEGDYLATRKAYLQQFKLLLSLKIDCTQFIQTYKESDLNHYYIWMMQALQQWLASKLSSAETLNRAKLNNKINELYQIAQLYKKQNGFNGINKKLNYQQLCQRIQQLQRS